MERQAHHFAPCVRDSPVGIERIEFGQKITRLRECGRGRRIEPGEFVYVAHAPGCKLEREWRKIGRLDFGNGLRNQAALCRLRPQPVARTRRKPPCAAGALLARCARDAHGRKARQPGFRIELWHAAIATVDNDSHALDGQARLGDRRGKHDLAISQTRAGPDRRILLLPRQIAVQGKNTNIIARRQSLVEPLLGATDLPRARQKHQHIAIMFRECL